jgi:hypothetical protein
MYGEDLAIHAEGGVVSATFFAMDHIVQFFYALLLPSLFSMEEGHPFSVGDEKHMRLLSISTHATHHLTVDYESVRRPEDQHVSDIGSVHALHKSSGAHHHL